MVTMNLGMLHSLHCVLDHVYGAFMHRTKMSPQIFSRGWRGTKLELLERMIKQLFPEAADQNWLPAVIQPTWNGGSKTSIGERRWLRVAEIEERKEDEGGRERKRRVALATNGVTNRSFTVGINPTRFHHKGLNPNF
ncbi:hypothetical protein ACFX2I_014074 [Malus domestica]